ncbi:MAG TPA: hypothetical protein VN328_00600 [Thermodesulfovibrionales bacterium]|nr:hypothetical protein [Thermodesulfovibrionales bacterium]
MPKKQKQSKKPDASKKILEGHKQVGKRFLPPFTQFVPKLTEVSYVHQLLHEIIWMGLINDEMGYKDGVQLAKRIAEIAKESHKAEKFVNFALARSYALLAPEEKTMTSSELDKAGILKQLQYFLSPLIDLYEGFPMSFLGRADFIEERYVLISRLKKCVARHFNKYKTPAMAIQAAVIYIRGTAGGLYLAEGIRVPDLDAIISDPESENAKHAGGFVRAGVLSEVMLPVADQGSEWAISFWNQGLRIDNCDVEDLSNDS